MLTHKDHQSWESSWWSNCVNTYNEEQKQFVYAEKMGLLFENSPSPGPVIDVKGKSILDIGGGPVSLLLKTKNLGYGVVVDPCDYPNWTIERYKEAKIDFIKAPAEDLPSVIAKLPQRQFDCIWIYNCLQHTIDPQKIAKNARRFSKEIRIFEWIDTGTAIGHPHELKEVKLNKWFGGEGKVETIYDRGCNGTYWAGIFKGDLYEE